MGKKHRKAKRGAGASGKDKPKGAAKDKSLPETHPQSATPAQGEPEEARVLERSLLRKYRLQLRSRLRKFKRTYQRRLTKLVSAGVGVVITLVLSWILIWQEPRSDALRVVSEQLTRDIQVKTALHQKLTGAIGVIDDNAHLDRLEEEAAGPELWPPSPALLGEYDRWLAEIDALLRGTNRTPSALESAQEALHDELRLVHDDEPALRTHNDGSARLRELEALLAKRERESDAGDVPAYRAAEQRRKELAHELAAQLEWQRFMLAKENEPIPQSISRKRELAYLSVAGEQQLLSMVYGGNETEVAEDLVAQAGSRINVMTTGHSQGIGLAYEALFLSNQYKAIYERPDGVFDVSKKAYAYYVRALAAFRSKEFGLAREAVEAMLHVVPAAERRLYIARSAQLAQGFRDWEHHVAERESSRDLVRRNIKLMEAQLRQLGDPDYVGDERAASSRNTETVELRRLVRRLRQAAEPPLTAEQEAVFRPLAGISPAQSEVMRKRPFGAGPVNGKSMQFGWGIVTRKKAALRLAQIDNEFPYANALWEQAITDAKQFSGNPVLERELDLIPIGKNASGLWEFAHVLTGSVPAPVAPIQVDQDTAIILVLVPGGYIETGCTPALDSKRADIGFRRDEALSPRVRLGPFFVSKYEITQAQWYRLTGEAPSTFPPAAPFEQGVVMGLHPIETVTWKQCERVLAWMGLDLPSEAQWEYAARGNTDTPFALGNGLYGDCQHFGNYDGLAAVVDGVAIPAAEDGWEIHAPVTETLANKFGLHGVCGNVREWCYDVYDPDGYRGIEVKRSDGRREARWDSDRVVRGGSFRDSVLMMRSAARDSQKPDVGLAKTGVRPVRLARLIAK